MFLKSPNLPDSKITTAVIGEGYFEIANELKLLGIDVFQLKANKNLGILSTHSDMLLYDAGYGNFYIDSTQEELCEKINKLGGREYKIEIPKNARYPDDVPLNAATVGEYLICNTKTVNSNILNSTNLKIINVKQGYSKCSTCIINSSAIITDDISIYNATKSVLDVLLITKGTIKLKGFNYGFVGGASVKLDGNTLAFTGKLNSHADADRIRSFIKNHSVDIIELSNSDIIDIGGIVPLTV